MAKSAALYTCIPEYNLPAGMTDIHLPLGYTECHPTALNNNGSVTGYFTTAGNFKQAFYWTPDKTLKLLSNGGSSSIPLSINDEEQIVGYSILHILSNKVVVKTGSACIWQKGGALWDLNELNNTGNYYIITATHITKDGKNILGSAYYYDDKVPEESPINMKGLYAIELTPDGRTKEKVHFPLVERKFPLDIDSSMFQSEKRREEDVRRSKVTKTIIFTLAFTLVLSVIFIVYLTIKNQ